MTAFNLCKDYIIPIVVPALMATSVVAEWLGI